MKPDIRKRDKVKETRVHMEPCDKVEQRQAPLVKEEVAKVGTLKITDHEKTPRESGRPKIQQMVNNVFLVDATRCFFDSVF